MIPNPVPETKEQMLEQTITYLKQLFRGGEYFEFITRAGTNKEGKNFPLRSRENITRIPTSPEEWDAFQASLSKKYDNCANGAWATFNPVNRDIAGQASSDKDVTDFRYALIEADDLAKEEQWKKISSLNLPIETIVWSGNKSYHILVKIEASTDKELFARRVKLLYNYLERKGFPADNSNKNPSRLTRIPGFMRKDDKQVLASLASGPATWQEFEGKYLPSDIPPDNRALTSAQNGMKGGRPTMPVTEYAELFLATHSENGAAQIHYWAKDWWQYLNGNWCNIPNDELMIMLTDFLQKQAVQNEGRISTSLISDIMANLKGLCGLTNVNMPCWLPNGEDASGVMRFSNGLLSIKKLIAREEQVLLAHTPNYFGLDNVDYPYLFNASCPQWQEYLETTFDNEESRKILQMMFGYVISGKMDKNVGFFLIGRGGDGKSVAAHILRKLVGESQTCCLPFGNLGDRFSSYLLTEHKLNLVEELPVGAEIHNIADVEKIFKMVTDGAEIPVEKKFHSPQKKRAIARCVFLANELPSFSDRSNGLWDRIVVLPFTHRFRDTDSEKANLKYDLESELPGIFNWAVEGARLLESCARFPVPSGSAEYLAAHRLACDHEVAFLKETVVGDPKGTCVRGFLYNKYREWVIRRGYKPLGNDRFNKALRTEFPDAKEMRERKGMVDRMIWSGIEYIGLSID